jgi:hypothetical protein
LWDAYVKEVDDWLFSKDFNAGLALFKTVEEKIMSEMVTIQKKRRESLQRRRSLIQEANRVLTELNVTELAGEFVLN